MILDEAIDHRPVGYGFITFFKNGTARVGDTFTQDEYRRQGWGRRRLELMNYIVSQLGGGVLRSGLSVEPEAESIWRALVNDGKAEELVSSGNLKSWRFIK